MKRDGAIRFGCRVVGRVRPFENTADKTIRDCRHQLQFTGVILRLGIFSNGWVMYWGSVGKWCVHSSMQFCSSPLSCKISSLSVLRLQELDHFSIHPLISGWRKRMKDWAQGGKGRNHRESWGNTQAVWYWCECERFYRDNDLCRISTSNIDDLNISMFDLSDLLCVGIPSGLLKWARSVFSSNLVWCGNGFNFFEYFNAT